MTMALCRNCGELVKVENITCTKCNTLLRASDNPEYQKELDALYPISAIGVGDEPDTEKDSPRDPTKS